MNPITSDVHKFHINKQSYILTENQKIQMAPRELSTGEKLLDLANRSVDPKEKKILEACAYDYLRALEKKGCADEGFYPLLARALSKILGNSDIEQVKEHISENSDWYKFFLTNNIQYQAHRQDFKLVDNVAGMVAVNGEWIEMNLLEKRATPEGFEFYREDVLLFKTDENLKLKGYFYGGQKGVVEGSPTQADTLGEFFQKPATGKYWVTVYGVAKDLTDLSFGRSHSYLGLEDSQGRVSYVGQFGVLKDFNVKDVVTPLGKKEMGIEIIDRYSSLPLSQYLLNEAKIQVTEQQYQILTDSIKRDSAEGVEGSLIKGNCSSYVKEKLKLIGVQAKISVTLQRYLFSQVIRVFPKSIQRKVMDWTKNTPDWLAKVLLFNPVVYLPTILVTGIAKLLSAGNDISLIQAIFKPWKLTVDHPIALFNWIDQCREDERQRVVLGSEAKARNDLGAIEKTALDLGFNNEQGRLKADRIKHITQYKPAPFPLMIIYALYKAIAHKLHNWLSKDKRINNQTSLLYLHALKNQRFITPYEFQNLRDTIGESEEFIYEITQIIQKTHKRGLIDRRSFIHLDELLKVSKTQEVLNYLMMLSLLNHINTGSHHNTLKEMITPEIQIEVEKIFSEYNKNYRFSVEGVHYMHRLCARINCYEWADKINDQDFRESLKQAIKGKDNKKFSTTLDWYFSSLKEQKGLVPLELRILSEMVEATTYPEGEDHFVNFSHLMQTQKVILDLEQNLDVLHNQLEKFEGEITDAIVTELKQLHQNIGVSLGCDLQYTGSATFFSLHSGILREKWERIENLLQTKIIPNPKELDLWPDVGLREIAYVSELENIEHKQEDQRKKVMFMYCSWGNGHRSVTDALQKYLGDDYRTTSCDIPDEVLIERDPLFNLLGRQHSITTLYNTLVAGDYWGTIRLMKKMGSKPTPEEEVEIQKDLIRRKILQERPDVVVATYARHSKMLHEVAKELGLPFVFVATDMVDCINTWDRLPNDPGFKALVPYNIPEMRAELEKVVGSIEDSRVEFAGYPIRPKFIQQMDKATLREKYNIADDEKVILCMNGGVGGDVPWPKLIADSKTEELGKSRVFVICGNNKSFKKSIEKLDVKNPNVTMTPLGFVNEESMAEYCEIADIVITKPGGATVAENLYKRNFMLLDIRNSKNLPWELAASEVLKNNNLANIIEPSRFIDTLQSAMDREIQDVPELNGNAIQPKEKFIQAIEEMVQVRQEIALNHPLYPTIDSIERIEKRLEQNVIKFLNFSEKLYPEVVLPSLKESLWGCEERGQNGKYLKFNVEKSRFEQCNEFHLYDMKYALSCLSRTVKSGEKIKPAYLTYFIHMVQRAKESNPKAVQGMIGLLCEIDRYRVSFLENIDVRTLDEAEALYIMPKAKKQLRKWVSLRTSNGRSAKNRDSNAFQMLPPEHAISVFITRPEEVDFLTSMHLHRKASTFEHKFKVENGHIHFLYNGELTPVSGLIGRFKN
ncbi:MAG: hypothetical protein WD595_00335, partial [Waddliaceae bacterium]